MADARARLARIRGGLAPGDRARLIDPAGITLRHPFTKAAPEPVFMIPDTYLPRSAGLGPGS
jgi:hypothetical protein